MHMQEVANATVDDGGPSAKAAVQRIAALGCHGKYAGNVARDLSRALAAHALLEPMLIDLPIMVKGNPQTLKVPVLSPHRLFAMLSEIGRLEETLVPDSYRGRMLSFWQKERRVQWLRDHPVFGLSEEYLSKTVAVKLHGDDAAAWKDKPVCYMSLSGFHHADVFESRLLICAIPVDRYVVQGKVNVTLQEMGRFLQAELDVLLSGVFPAAGFDNLPCVRAGQPLAGGWRAAFLGTTGDLIFVRSTVRIPAMVQLHESVLGLPGDCFTGGAIL